MDKTTLTDFQAKFELAGEVSFADFWDEIDREFGRDADHQNKQAWRRVRLHIAGKRLKSKEWRTFEKEFILRRNRVDDRTENQEYELIMAQLPSYWGNEVAKAESKKNSGGFWVKITNLPSEMTKSNLRRTLRGIDCEPRNIIKTDNGFLVSLDDEDDRSQLLKKDGHRVEGHRIGLSRARVKLSPAEIFALIADRLQTSEYAEDMRRTIQGYHGEGTQMHAVEVEHTPPNDPPRRPEKPSVEIPAAKPPPRQPEKRDTPPPRPDQQKNRPPRNDSPGNRPANPQPQRDPSPSRPGNQNYRAPTPPRTQSENRSEPVARRDWGNHPPGPYENRTDPPSQYQNRTPPNPQYQNRPAPPLRLKIAWFRRLRGRRRV